MDIIRTALTSVAGTGGAYAASGNEQKMMMDIVRGTPLDPKMVEYAATGMDPLWAFITVATVGMGPTVAKTFGEWMQSRNVRAERILEAQLNGLIEKDIKDV